MVDGCFIKVKYYTNQKIPSTKVKIKVTFNLEQAMKAQRGSSSIVLQLNLGARWGLVVHATSWPRYPWEGDPVPTVQVAGWAPEMFWTGVEILSPLGFDPWTVQLVASRCTNYTPLAHFCQMLFELQIFIFNL